MTAKFLYRLQGGDTTKVVPFPDEPAIIHPPIGAVYMDKDGRWICEGPADEAAPAKEAERCS